MGQGVGRVWRPAAEHDYHGALPTTTAPRRRAGAARRRRGCGCAAPRRASVAITLSEIKWALASISKNPNCACPGPCWLVPDRPGTNLAADQMLRLRT